MISVIINAYNAGRFINEVLDAIVNQTVPPHEIIIVNDGSTDDTLKIARGYPKTLKKELRSRFAMIEKFRVINQENKGIAASANRAIKESKGDIVISIESDAVVEPRFIERTIKALDADPELGAVAGYIKTANKNNFWARIMGYDLEYRYDYIGGIDQKNAYLDHVSPNNTAYRRKVFDKTGYFNTDYHYCQDVEFSHRMKKKGFKLMLLKSTGCKHYWKESFIAYTKQQYNVSFGRLKFVSKNPKQGKGDEVADWRMFMQVPLTGLVILSAIAAAVFPLIWPVPLLLLGLLLLDRYTEAGYLIRKKKDWSLILMPFVHIWRNIVWGCSVLHYLVGKK